jgi:integrase
MARSINKLSALKTRTKAPGLHGDGGGLYLQVTDTGAKSWVFRYKVRGQSHYMGLGSLTTVTLAEAREAATNCRRLRLQGIDPLADRKRLHDQRLLEAAKSKTFDQCRDQFLAAHKGSWRNPKHRAQWVNTLRTYVTPVFGNISVQSIDVELVRQVLEPIWMDKPETASRVRGRIESILDWAKVRGLREGENPARWRGHLGHLLPSPSKVRMVKHHASMPYGEVADFVARLRELNGVGSRALELLVLTGTRTGETLNATWDEFDLNNGTWTIPAERMKGNREHRVPLSESALSVIQQMLTTRASRYIFPGAKTNHPLSNMTLSATLKRMGHRDITPHGFRSTFRTWAAEQTGIQSEVVEAALAHVIGNKVVAAYQRGDLFEKRRALMKEWARYCAGTRRQAAFKVQVGGTGMRKTSP